MIKLLKLLSGAAAMFGGLRRVCTSSAPSRPTVCRDIECSPSARFVAGGSSFRLDHKTTRNLKTAIDVLVQERQELRNQLRQSESKSDAEQRGEYAAELDKVKSFLNRRHGFSVSRMQVASAVEAISRNH